jgi:NADPH:quinone reductase-like Zn-dependent oxidoreductase
LRELGASHVINYRRYPDLSQQVLDANGGSGADYLIETGGAGTLDQSIKAAAVGGSISVIGMLTGTYGTFNTCRSYAGHFVFREPSAAQSKCSSE